MYSRAQPQSGYVNMDAESMNYSVSSLTESVYDEGRMRRKLRYFFMDPCQKYRTKRRLPFKLILQVMKIAVVTFQLVMFGLDAERHAVFVEKNLVTFKHLYLYEWDPTLETMPYPPTRGPFAVYTYEKMYKAVDFLLNRYNQTLQLALGSYDFAARPPPPVRMCRSFYSIGEIYANNQSYNFRDHINHECTDVTPVEDEKGRRFDFAAFTRKNNISLNFDSINVMSFHFSLKSVNLRSIDMDQQPDCYKFDIRVELDNKDHSGEVGVSLQATMQNVEPCMGRIIHPSKLGLIIRVLLSIFDIFVIILCILSIGLCFRSLTNACRMRALAIKYFLTCHGHDLCKEDRRTFVDGWLILIIVSDVLVIVGSFIKLLTDNSITDKFEVGGVALGLGVCFVWCGILRYLGFFGKYNILLRVLSVAMPSVLRFLVCAGVLFSGFTLCGWVVIGPYHVKFKTIESTVACLFSLLNGDDMYVTFTGVPKARSLFCFYFNFLYLLIFISLFTYAVLNVFVTIIIDAYEVMKEGSTAEPTTFMWTFIGNRRESSANARLYLRDEADEGDCNIGRICSDFFLRVCCCCAGPLLADDGENENEDLTHDQNENPNGVGSSVNSSSNLPPVAGPAVQHETPDERTGLIVNNR